MDTSNVPAHQTPGLTPEDRTELLWVLATRFGPLPRALVEAVERLEGPNAVDHCLLAVANAPTVEVAMKALSLSSPQSLSPTASLGGGRRHG
ncbi:MAG: hypothetical protein K6U14_03795 [Firmicutes bacterium]|nr:hypothetical protein [Alicyclobacillaceae bacterium]MCL6496744.1 hypothetical protein [Bacillota bacterium]